jgi:hypothetical protein
LVLLLLRLRDSKALTKIGCGKNIFGQYWSTIYDDKADTKNIEIGRVGWQNNMCLTFAW